MNVVPAHPEIEIEDVPADSLASMREDGGAVANERASVVAEGGQAVATAFDDAVLAGAVVCPSDLTTDRDRYVRRVECEVDNGDGGWVRGPGLNRDRAGHHRAVDTTDIIVGSGDCKDRRDIGAANVERCALEHRRPAEAVHLMEE